MLMYRKVVVGDAERGLVHRNRRFERILMPGVHRLVGANLQVHVFDITQPDYTGKDADALVAALGDRIHEYFVFAETGETEVGLVLRNGLVHGVMLPGQRRLFWRGLVETTVRSVSFAQSLALPAALAKRLRQIGLLDAVALAVTVPEGHAALVFVDGTLDRTLEPGAYAFWNVARNVVADVVELRVQAMDVAGQELLTRDKVSLRVNLSANLRVVDPVLARTKTAKYQDYVYRELQFGLRKAVSAKTLDELLGDKASLDADIFGHVQGRVEAFGIEVLGVGVKDVILPGEMKDILNAVVQAEKSAQANVIRRREESNATRSLLNTARLVEESPVLMRLKELETLEKVTEKIDKLTVFGGLDGVLKQVISIK